MVTPQYDSDLSLKFLETRYGEIERKFNGIQSRYIGLSSRRDLGEEDRKSLSCCIEVLSTLAKEDLVQEQFMKERDFEKTLSYKMGELSIQILEYTENFNTDRSRFERFWS